MGWLVCMPGAGAWTSAGEADPPPIQWLWRSTEPIRYNATFIENEKPPKMLKRYISGVRLMRGLGYALGGGVGSDSGRGASGARGEGGSRGGAGAAGFGRRAERVGQRGLSRAENAWRRGYQRVS